LLKNYKNNIKKKEKLIIKLSFTFLDSWDNESVSLYVDRMTDPVPISIQSAGFPAPPDVCGMSSWGD
jgi:hypothetical protein